MLILKSLGRDLNQAFSDLHLAKEIGAGTLETQRICEALARHDLLRRSDRDSWFFIADRKHLRDYQELGFLDEKAG